MNYYIIHPNQYSILTEIKYFIAHLIDGTKIRITIHNSLLDKMIYYQVTTYNHFYNHFIPKKTYNHFYNRHNKSDINF